MKAVNTHFLEEGGILLSDKEIAKTFRKTPHTIRRWVREGNFPKPIKVGRSTFWRSSKIKEFLDSKSEESA